MAVATQIHAFYLLKLGSYGGIVIWMIHTIVWLLVFVPVITVVFCLADLESRDQETYTPVHIINIDVQDNHEEATIGAFMICEMCKEVSFCFHYCNH